MSTTVSLISCGEIGTGLAGISSFVPLTTETGTIGTIRIWVATALVLTGVFFLTVGTVGLLRMPNMYNRMHATTKASTIGVVSMFLAAFVLFGPGGAGLTSIVGIVFLFLTVPTGSHLLLQSAIRMGVPFEDETSWPDEE